VGRRANRSGRLAFEAAWLGALLVAAWLTPRLVDGYRALQWTRFHAARVGGPRPGEHARKAAHAAARAIDLTAPLPWAREAARLVLDASNGLEEPNRPSAEAACDEVRGALDRASASRFRRVGLGALAEEARARGDEARTPGPQPRPAP
jgi:hypothetical protein